MRSKIACGALALALTLVVAMSGAAARPRPPSAVPAAWRAAARSSALAEAARWLGGGNPTGFHEAWCRDFVNFVLLRTDHRLADRSHLAITALRLGPRVAAPKAGDLAVMAHHVTFYAGPASGDTFLGLGGNQSHRVTLARFRRAAVVAFIEPR